MTGRENAEWERGVDQAGRKTTGGHNIFVLSHDREGVGANNPTILCSAQSSSEPIVLGVGI